ncbi:MAG TPA: hypothetical protein PK955_09305, partial [Methanoregulaceae archaeon]|nr:hypothetical protein [Methanoregulaceae archaeon]
MPLTKSHPTHRSEPPSPPGGNPWGRYSFDPNLGLTPIAITMPCGQGARDLPWIFPHIHFTS